MVVTAHARLGAWVSRYPPGVLSRRAKKPKCKAQTLFWLLKKMIFKDHLLLRTTRMFEINPPAP
jgi:hypothetical protein